MKRIMPTFIGEIRKVFNPQTGEINIVMPDGKSYNLSGMEL